MIISNLNFIKSEIKKLTSKPVTVVAVTKNRTLDEINIAIEAGITDIGENRLQEADGKLPHLPKNITKHFIGRLQTNKVRDAIKLFDVIQSVDSLKLAEKIDRECEKAGKIIPILIQVNTSDESQKGGVSPSDAAKLIADASKLKNIQVQGLMTIAIHSDDKDEVRDCFKKLKQLFDKVKKHNPKITTLSMGMSEDFQIATEEGSNMVRIGRRIFD